MRDAHPEDVEIEGNVLDPLDLIDGIDLEALVEKRKSGDEPQMAKQIETATRKEYPDGIRPSAPTRCASPAALASTGRDIKFNRIQGYRNFCNKL